MAKFFMVVAIASAWTAVVFLNPTEKAFWGAFHLTYGVVLTLFLQKLWGQEPFPFVISRQKEGR